MSATTTQLLSSGECCKLRYDTIPIKSQLQTFLSLSMIKKCQIFSCDTLVANEQYVLPTQWESSFHELTNKFNTPVLR